MVQKSILVCLLCFAIQSVRSQGIDTLLNRYNKQVPQEKAYIHFDNTAYLPGETVFYQSYLMIGADPSWLSRNFYIDWLDEEGNLVDRTVAPVLGFSASGSFTIPQNLKGNILQAVAYTRWMLNFDSAFLFRKTLPLAQNTTPSQPLRTPPSLVFFPEGGDMVEGIPSWVAFKAGTAAGAPLEIEGVLKNGSGQALGGFRSQHNGMGKLQFTPQKGETYIAEWKDRYGNSYQTALPKAKASGIVVSIGNVSGARIFSVERAAELEPRFERVTVVASMNQQAVFRAAASFTTKTKLVSTLPVKDLPSGILQFTVFDAGQQPVAERILFVNNHEFETRVQLQRDTFTMAKRGRNVFEIEIPDTSLASFSLSVTDGDGVYDSSEQIITRLLLTGELKGYVHDPAYYFSSGSDTVAAHLDLLMLTHGWRRFKWEHVLAGALPSLIHQADTSFIGIAGQVTQGRKKEETITLLVSATDSTEQLFYVPLQPDGKFEENNLIMFDTVKLYALVQGTGLKLSKPVVLKNTFLPLDRRKKWSFIQQDVQDTLYRLQLSAIFTRQQELERLMRGTTLKEVVVKARPKTRSEELNERYASPLYNAIDDIRINVVDDRNATSSLTVLHYLEGKVAGLRAYNIYGTSLRPGADEPRLVWRGENVLFLLNEMPVDIRQIWTLPMSDVAFIKAFRNSFFGFKTGGGGNVIAVYTKKGNDELTNERKGMPFTPIAGYTPVKEFYSPDYAQPLAVNIRDYRRTLLWQPNITTGKDSRTVRVSFYNNDISTSFRVVMEGMTQDGKLVHFSKLIK